MHETTRVVLADSARVERVTATKSVKLPSGATCALHGRDPRARLVNELMTAGYAARRIMALAHAQGYRVSEKAISQHRRLCFVDETDSQAQARDEDLAVLVRDEVRRGILSGQVELKASDGIKAQGLLDRRAEKSAERSFMLNLAQLLSGGGRPAPPEIVETTVIDVTPSPLLAPPELREPS
jgi:hypothetical protein